MALLARVGGALLVAQVEVGHLLTTGRPDVAQMVFNCLPMMLILISQSFHFARTSLARVFALHVAVSPAIAAYILFWSAVLRARLVISSRKLLLTRGEWP